MGLAAFHCRQSPQNTGSQIKCKKPMFLSALPLSQGHGDKRTNGRKGALGRDATTLGEGKEAQKVLGGGRDEELSGVKLGEEGWMTVK